MNEFFSKEKLLEYWEQALAWSEEAVWSPASLTQIAIILAALLIGHIVARWVKRGLDKACENIKIYRKYSDFVAPLYRPILFVLLLLIGRIALVQLEQPVYLLDIALSLLSAWIVIRLATNFITNQSIARLVAVIAWSIAALNIVGVLDPLINVLQAAAFSVGKLRISLFGIISGLLTLMLLIWIALVVSRLVEDRLKTFYVITPSARVLIAKIVKIVLISIALTMAVTSMGFDLTALAVFGGALGVGIGFGLQKVVANFISGVILLLDRSIKPGDVIETQNTYGEINKLAARYTSIITRDGTEFLIPNEDIITQPVINWSHSSTEVRRRIPINVSYNSDLRKAMDLMNEVAVDHPRVISSPEPRTLLKGFGDNGVDLELRMWINDPQNGVSNVASDVLLGIWDKFHEAGVEFPFPQRVVHFANGDDEGDEKQKPPATKAEKSEPAASPPEPFGKKSGD